MKATATVLSASSNETTAHTAGAVHTSNGAFNSVQMAATAAVDTRNLLPKSTASLSAPRR